MQLLSVYAIGLKQLWTLLWLTSSPSCYHNCLTVESFVPLPPSYIFFHTQIHNINVERWKHRRIHHFHEVQPIITRYNYFHANTRRYCCVVIPWMSLWSLPNICIAVSRYSPIACSNIVWSNIFVYFITISFVMGRERVIFRTVFMTRMHITDNHDQVICDPFQWS